MTPPHRHRYFSISDNYLHEYCSLYIFVILISLIYFENPSLKVTTDEI